MERLDTLNSSNDSYLEAAIHIARYASVSSLVRGKSVLDLACGEGFGAYFLTDFEPGSIVAVDISPEAIERAQQNFKSNLVQYRVGDANQISSELAGQKFDLICSFETFEHLEDPTIYLKQLKYLLNPGGVIAISCPNDNWYYPEPGTSNPFHVRKYSFDEFKKTTEDILGKCSYWLSGTPVVGFQNSQLFPYTERSSLGKSWLEVGHSNSFEVGDKHDTALQEITPSYWIGIWGETDIITCGAQARISMETLSQFYETQSSWADRVPSVAKLEARLESTILKLQLATEQNRLMRIQIDQLQSGAIMRRKSATLFRRFIVKYTAVGKKLLPSSTHERIYTTLTRFMK